MCSLFGLANHSLKAERKIIKEMKNIDSFDCLINFENIYILFETWVSLFVLPYYALKAESKIIK